MPHRLLAIVLAFAAPAFAGDDIAVRVKIFDLERPASATVTAERGPVEVLLDGRPWSVLPAGSPVVLEARAGMVVLRYGGASLQASAVLVMASGDAVTRIVASNRRRAYRGRVEVTAEGNQLHLINEVSLDHYIASVVPDEFPFQEIEGVKAQAVLVRTYALRSAGRFGHYDLVDHERSQVYRGADSETAISRLATELTRGEVLTYQGELIEAVYSSSSGGHTADNESVWTGGRPRPYLRGRPDPYDTISPFHRWTETIDRRRFLQAVSRAHGVNATGIVIAGTSREGRVTHIRILTPSGNRVEQANAFRLAVNRALRRQVLRSTFFTVAVQGGRYVFTGRGFGHGVGMSQWGAHRQATMGRTYQEILASYFTGATLMRIGAPELLAAPPLADRAATPRPAAHPAGAPVAAGPATDGTPNGRAPAPRSRHRTGW